MTTSTQTGAVQSQTRFQLSQWSNAIGRVFVGKDEILIQALTTFLAGGHLLIEDVPGVGKTTLALTLAKLFGCDFQRIQCTSDLMPTDFIGVSVLDPKTQTFEFKPGPLFHQIVLVDELNRATPRTQSALLECMSERHVSVDQGMHLLPEPFFVIATQNPFEQHGVFPLPESQLDRFMMRLSIGYPNPEQERAILQMQDGGRRVLEDLPSLCQPSDLLRWMQAVKEVRVASPVDDYILAILAATRQSTYFQYGASPRAAVLLRQAAQAYAWVHERDYTLPDDVKALAVSVVAHRLLLRTPLRQGEREQVEARMRELLQTIPIPL